MPHGFLMRRGLYIWPEAAPVLLSSYSPRASFSVSKMLFVQRLRIPLYATLILFSFLLFCLCCARLHFTTVEGYYDPIVVELLVTTLLTIPFAAYIIYSIYHRVENKYVSRFREEIAGLAILWLFWIVGAGEASAIWVALGVCQQYAPCQVLSALLAFSWLGWITLSGILVLDTLFVVANKFWMEPLHGRLDPRISGAFS